MKLSLDRKLGWIHCRGGQLLRVAKPHTVPVTGRSLLPPGLPMGAQARLRAQNPLAATSPQEGRTVAETREGDLVVEIVQAQTGKTLGYSYLSGAAIQLNHYDHSDASRYTPATGRLLTIPDPRRWEGSREEFGTALATVLIGAKYSDDDVAAFELDASNAGEARAAANAIMEVFAQFTPVEAPPREPKTHLFGLIKAPKRTEIVGLHFQPPADAGDFAATGFQTSLVLSALRERS